jgi:hypothetical protein
MSRAHKVVSSILVVVAFFCGVALSGYDRETPLIAIHP